MVTLRSHYLAAGLVLVLASCTAPAPVDQRVVVPEAPAVVLVVGGSAFDAPAPRAEATTLAAEQMGQPARTIREEPAVERVIQRTASRLDRSVAHAASAESRNRHCQKKGRTLATAIAERADVVLRVQLDAKTTSHPATRVERRELSGSRWAGIVSAMGLGDDTVYETTIDGSVERTTFPGSPNTVRQLVKWSGRRLGRKDVTPSPSVRDALAEALAAMPAPAPARWDRIAGGLVSGGCPVLGTAVADTFLDDGALKRRIRAAAVAALGWKSQSTRAPKPDHDPAPEPPTTEIISSCAGLCTVRGDDG